MALAGRAIIAIWNDITPEGRANFNEWHPREHMPERVGIPGFRRGRRYVATEGGIEFFTLYEADNVDVLVSPDYKARLNSPTSWSRTSVAAFRNNLRGVCRVVQSQGHADGAHLFTIRLSAEAGREVALEKFITDQIPAILERPEITGTHLCVCDHTLSGTNTNLQRERKIGVPDWVVMIEGATAAGVKAQGRALLDRKLTEHGAKPDIVGELYQLEYSIAKFGAA